MTLHLWMHWFWVTAIVLNAVCWAMPPESSDQYIAETKAYHVEDGPTFTEATLTENSHERIGKSIVFTRKSTVTPTILNKPQDFINPYPQSSDIPDVGGEFVQRQTIILPTVSNLNKTDISKEVENVSASYYGESNVSHADIIKPSVKSNSSKNDFNSSDDHPTNTSNDKPNVRQVSITYSSNETLWNSETKSAKESTSNKSVSITNDTVSVEYDSKEENITEKPLSLETTIEVEHILSSLQAIEPTKGKITLAAASIEDQPSDESMDTAAVAGISFAALVLVALTGATSFVLYRRRYLNKPQTLNDKCSNPDSSGYIDDSTIRENSEEMYSLDNDSFLNSLEAMTIQNYWTDTVKHTKL